ncbi:MAG TPA: hypothetical protein PLS50_09575 [Candidatus Dojkabacteria bacterium]|nr:hypothetical protein [Candidatus Dojkabacteria bacterium]
MQIFIKVLNIEDTIAVSMNYIDLSNYELAFKELSKEASAGDNDVRVLLSELM